MEGKSVRSLNVSTNKIENVSMTGLLYTYRIIIYQHTHIHNNTLTSAGSWSVVPSSLSLLPSLVVSLSLLPSLLVSLSILPSLVVSEGASLGPEVGL